MKSHQNQLLHTMRCLQPWVLASASCVECTLAEGRCPFKRDLLHRLRIRCSPYEGKHKGACSQESFCVGKYALVRSSLESTYGRIAAISRLIFFPFWFLRQHSQRWAHSGTHLAIIHKHHENKMMSVMPAQWLVHLGWSVQDLAKCVGLVRVLREVIFHWC